MTTALWHWLVQLAPRSPPPSAEDWDNESGKEWEGSSLENYQPSDFEAVAEESQEALAAAEDLFGASPSDFVDAEAGAGSPPADVAPPDEALSSAACSLVADISSEGYVPCPLAPWSGQGRHRASDALARRQAARGALHVDEVLAAPREMRARSHAP